MTLKTTVAALGAVMALTAGTAQAASIYATQVDVSRIGVAGAGWDATSQSSNSDRTDAGNALGAPDQGNALGSTDNPNESQGFYSLGRGGIAVFDFGQAFDDTVGVFEVTFGCNDQQKNDGTCFFTETADLYLFSGAYTPFDGTFSLADIDALGFAYEASIPNGVANQQNGFTVAIDGPFTYLALVDTTTRQGGDGFDVDAVSVQPVGTTPTGNPTPVPLPASALLLLAGVGGLGALRRFGHKS